MRELKAAAYVGKHGCEHQDFMQPVKIIPGTGPDVGNVTIQIGSTHVTFNSTSALIAALSRASAAGLTAATVALVG